MGIFVKRKQRTHCKYTAYLSSIDKNHIVHNKCWKLQKKKQENTVIPVHKIGSPIHRVNNPGRVVWQNTRLTCSHRFLSNEAKMQRKPTWPLNDPKHRLWSLQSLWHILDILDITFVTCAFCKWHGHNNLQTIYQIIKYFHVHVHIHPIPLLVMYQRSLPWLRFPN